MELEATLPSTSPVKCCDCGCESCAAYMNQSLSGTWFRSVKRKYDEFEEGNGLVIPGLVISQFARIEVKNECSALREMVSSQQQTIQDLSSELEEERNAASSAANEAMSMILRLQREKAEIQMEARQFKRFVEEKMAHDQQELHLLEDLLYKKEQTIESLICEVQAYKHRMMSYGLTEAEDEGRKGCMSQNSSDIDNTDSQSEFPVYDYPPLKCNSNETNYHTLENERADVEKHAFDETTHSCEHLKNLVHRINHLERAPRSNKLDEEFFGTGNVPEKVIVGQSPGMTRHSRKFSSESSSSFFAMIKEMGSDCATDSHRKLGESTRKMEYSEADEYSNLKKVDDTPNASDDSCDRVYTIDSVHQGVSYNDVGVTEAKCSGGLTDDHMTTPRDSLNYEDIGDPNIKWLYMKLQALEADRESMKQAIVSMRTDKAQLVLLKEIAQQLCKEMSPARRMPVRKPSPVSSFSMMSIFKWTMTFVFWRRKARHSKYMFGQSGNNTGLLVLLDKGPHIGQWRRLSKTQM